jgi:ribosome-associated protein
MFTNKNNLPGVTLAPGIWTDRSELRFAFSRSSGPGGQNVNKVNTKTELRVNAQAIHGLSDTALKRLTKLAGRRLTANGDILLISERQRTQEANRTACLTRLREMVFLAQVEPIRRRKTRPTRGSQERRIESKKMRGHIKRTRSAQW